MLQSVFYQKMKHRLGISKKRAKSEPVRVSVSQTGGSKTQIHRLHRLHRLRIFLKIAEHQSVFYFFKKTQTQYYKTQTGRVLLNGTYLSGMQQA